PTLMRWLNPDPLGFAAGDPNLYRAEGDAPASKTDYSGLRGLDLCEKCAAALFLPVVSSTAKKNLKGIINQTSIAGPSHILGPVRQRDSPSFSRFSPFRGVRAPQRSWG